ncbi:MAG: cupin domain-containing protein [Fimbriimonadaceae bacterium]|nr:cupin domain-containing protein [Fimbriimonadaceae bacterium]
MVAPRFGRLTDAVPDASKQETFETLYDLAGLRIERIVSRGQTSPDGFWYKSTRHEFVLVAQGSGELEFADGSRRRLEAGDWALLPAGCRHRVSETRPEGDTIWLAVHWPDAP